jgi:hypothetical protein
VGFHGKSGGEFCKIAGFGTISAPRSVGLMGLQDQIFDTNELRNTVGMVTLYAPSFAGSALQIAC